MRKLIIKFICITIIFVMFCMGFKDIFRFKYGDGIYPLDVFYNQEPDSIDVMFFGSSHVFENVNTGVLWDEYGMASFNLCGSVQPMWNTYYYMEEALKTQTPELIVLDTYRALEDREYVDDSRIIKNNYGLKLSENKIKSVKISSPQSKWADYMLEYPTYHGRYQEIQRIDFTKNLGIKDWEYWKGFGLNTETTPLEEPVNIQTDEIGTLYPKTEEYLLEIIRLAKQKEIPLLLITTPYYTNVESQKIYNRVRQIASQYDVPYIDFNMLYQEIGLDFSVDFADGDHLNHKGNTKFSVYLGNYIKENYNIPDRRKDNGYESYQVMADNVRQRIYNQTLAETADIGTFIDLTQNEHYLTIFSASGDYKQAQNYEAVKSKLLEIGINLDDAEADYAWIEENNKIVHTSANENTFLWHTKLENDNNIMVQQKEKLIVNYNNSDFSIVENGLNIMVYDKITGELVENVGFEYSGGVIQYGKINKEQSQM